jgi:hypothetical protein
MSTGAKHQPTVIFQPMGRRGYVSAGIQTESGLKLRAHKQGFGGFSPSLTGF